MPARLERVRRVDDPVLEQLVDVRGHPANGEVQIVEVAGRGGVLLEAIEIRHGEARARRRSERCRSRATIAKRSKRASEHHLHRGAAAVGPASARSERSNRGARRGGLRWLALGLLAAEEKPAEPTERHDAAADEQHVRDAHERLCRRALAVEVERPSDTRRSGTAPRCRCVLPSATMPVTAPPTSIAPPMPMTIHGPTFGPRAPRRRSSAIGATTCGRIVKA